MENWILKKVIKNKNTKNKEEMRVFNNLLNTEFGKEIIVEIFKIGFVEAYENSKKC